MRDGTQLGHYRITGKLGEGGMGQVFRAEDENLKRPVAIKVLPPEMARDPERMARMEREAQTLAQLEHPNIASIHGFEQAEVDGETVRFLVMQLAEGRNLSQRIDEGRVPLQEALKIALQIARALEAAHERGIVHRDLKPANVMLADDGAVKLLDFGLAKAFSGDLASSSPNISASPTMLEATKAGMILGTAGYMSPEQARGKVVDRRTDVWAFGCVLYEMLTGGRLFDGETVTDVLGAIVHRDPDWEALPKDTPRRVRALLTRCLRKDIDRRIQAIGDARVSIEEYLEDPVAADAILGDRPKVPAWQTYLPWGVAAVLAVVAGVGLLRRAAPAPEAPTLRMDMAIGVAEELRDRSLGSSLVISPDGSQIGVVTGASQAETILRLRRLATTDTVEVAAGGAYNPFFSPDGQWIGFALPASLQKVPVTGGTPLEIVQVARSRGATWMDDGRIIYAPYPNTGLMAVSSDGGEPEQITTPDEAAGEVTHRWPHWIPGTRKVLFTAHTSPAGSFDGGVIQLLDLDSGDTKVVYRGGYYGQYVQSGHLLFVNDGTLFAVPFDIDDGETVGSAVPVAQLVADDTAEGGAQYDVSDNGILLYRMGEAGPGTYPALWVTREGDSSPLLSEPRTYVEARVSPDGRQVAMAELNADNWDVWVYDVARGTRTRLTFAPGIEGPAVWSPDSTELVYSSDEDGSDDLYRKAADGSGDAVQITHDNVSLFVSDWSSDGRYVLTLRAGVAEEGSGWAGGADIGYVDLEGDGTVQPFLATRFSESEAMFSPDGKWVSYQSNESGRQEIYVRPFPPAGGRWQISDQGGAYARWAPDGRELYYRTDDGIMVVDVQAGGATFSASRPRLLTAGAFQGGLSGLVVSGTTFADWDVAPDGRFVMFPHLGGEAPNVHLARIVVNWFPELQRLAPRR